MEKLDFYRHTVQNILTAIAAIPYSDPAIAHEAVFDGVNDRYLVMSVGWKKPTYRLHFCLVHVDIRDGKIWIQRDGTEDGIAAELLAAGIPKESIVLAFRSAARRALTEFAAA